MAVPREFAGQTDILKAPPGLEDVIVPLPVCMNINNETFTGEAVSCWVLSDIERATVAKTGLVWLAVHSIQRHPPVFVSGLPLMKMIDTDGFAVEYDPDAILKQPIDMDDLKAGPKGVNLDD